MMNVLRVLVTGGAGFVGSHLCRRLLADGHEVICLDNMFTGNKGNILDLMDKPRFEFMRHDVTFSLYVEVDRIYNLACPASPIHYQFDEVQTTLRKYSIVLHSPSSRDIFGSHPSISLAKVISGWRWRGSSAGNGL